MIVVEQRKQNDFLRFCQNKLPKFNTSEVGEIARERG